MKFAKTLEDEAIPEWKANYFDYKQAKKKLKAIDRAVRNVPSSPQIVNGQGDAGAGSSSLRDAPVFSLLRRRQTFTASDAKSQQDKRGDFNWPNPALQSHLATATDFTPSSSTNELRKTARDGRPKTAGQADERTALKDPVSSGVGRDLPQQQKRMRSYGSIIGSPANSDEDDGDDLRLRHEPASLRLPNPAVPLDDDPDHESSVSPTTGGSNEQQGPKPPATQMSHTGNAYEIGPAVDLPFGSGDSIKRIQSQSARSMSTPGGNHRPMTKRLFSAASNLRTKPRQQGGELPNDIALEAYRELDFRKADFFALLDKELLKIDNFYTEKEENAVKQLAILRDQLHILRQRRFAEIEHQAKYGQATSASTGGNDTSAHGHRFRIPFLKNGPDENSALRKKFANSVDVASGAIDRVRNGHVGKTSKAMNQLGTPTGTWQPHPDQRDYGTRLPDVSHHTAKRKMKAALSEYYRSLELLKSYAATNRTAFKKIVKKYDKTARSRHKGQYMDDHVNRAHFVKSDTVETLMSDCESLYSRYFERGNHKIAVSKLRAKVAKVGDYTDSVARTCFLLGSGTFMGFYGLVNGVELLYSPNAVRHQAATFLLQLYAGYFLMVLLTGLFVLNAAMFARFKVNYPFIFELNPKSRLDWLQLAEIPAVFFFLLGGTMWLNFSIQAGGEAMLHWWFVVLISVSLILFLLPFRVFHLKTRLFFLDTVFRLVFSGFFTVEFRDFFLGDMFCSLTYPLGNIELFFCLYARQWTYDIEQCTSSRSRLLGFFSALPGIWRAIQCVRRFVNTGAAFPHMFNFGKYCCTILQYVSLSIYRIDKTPGSRAFFIVAATINGVYCSIWDVNYDWSLGNVKQKKFRGLRPLLSYQKQAWIYYFAMIVDPILRFNWIFYAIYTQDIQHATLVSFLVALSEVFRRGLWVLFRVENEHCTNIFRQKATRDFDLPYEVAIKDVADSSVDPSRPQSLRTDGTADQLVQGSRTGTADGTTPDAESGRPGPDVDSPIARALHRVGTTLRMGHQQDYVRKQPEDTGPADSDDDESDEE